MEATGGGAGKGRRLIARSALLWRHAVGIFARSKKDGLGGIMIRFSQSGWRRMRAVAVCAGLAVWLSSCAVTLTAPYDAQIDSMLSDLNTDTTAFVTRMTSLAGTPAGSYDQNKDFYITEEAKIDTLIVRAQVHKALNTCPSTGAVQAAVQFVSPQVQANAGSPLASIGSYIQQLPADDCEVVLFTLLKRGYGDLETFHQAQGPKGIPPSARDPILVGGVGALIRAGMAVEAAKKASEGQIGAK
jgi:hypothetical protein